MGISLGVVAGSIALMAGTTFAQGSTAKSTRPGWGLGDKNHVHTGPPGQSVRVGPPGQSVSIHAEDRSTTSVSNTFAVSSKTGGNRVSDNSGGTVHVSSGASSTVLSIVNALSHSLFGS